MQKIRFNPRSLDALKEGSYTDELLPAFCIRVGKNKKTFFTIREGKRTTIGHYPSMTLQDARRQARLVLSDPEAMHERTTLEDAIEAYLRTRDYRPRVLYNAENQLKRHFKPWLAMQFSDVTTRKLSNLFDELRHTPSEANHLFGVARTFFRWAAQRGYGQNPLTFPKPYKERTRERTLSDDELVKVWEASMHLGVFGRIVRLCILTAQRRGELAQMRPDWIDTFSLTIPGTVAKNGKTHTLQLPPEALKLALNLSNDLDRTWTTWSKPKALLDKISGVSDYTLHDLRRTAASKMAELGIAPHVIEKILNHSAPASLGGAVGAIYNRHSYSEEMREALTRHENWLLKHLETAAVEA